MFSYLSLQSNNSTKTLATYSKLHDNEHLRMQNLELRKKLGANAKGIPTYFDRIQKKSIVIPSDDEIEKELKEEQKELKLMQSINFFTKSGRNVLFLASLACMIGLVIIDKSLNWISETIAKGRAEKALLEAIEEFDEPIITPFQKLEEKKDIE